MKDEHFAFGRVLPDTWAFYDYVIGKEDDVDLKEIILKPIAFKIWVAEFSLKKKVWEVIGNIPLSDDLKRKIYFYKQDPINNRVWKTITGEEELPVTVNECLEFEVAAVWDPEHVAERLNYLFSGDNDPDLEYDKNLLLTKGISTK